MAAAAAATTIVAMLVVGAATGQEKLVVCKHMRLPKHRFPIQNKTKEDCTCAFCVHVWKGFFLLFLFVGQVKTEKNFPISLAPLA